LVLTGIADEDVAHRSPLVGARLPLCTPAAVRMRSSTASSARLVAMPLRWFSRQIIRLYAQKRMGKDTVGELKSAEICVSHMPALKAKKLGKLPREKVLLEL
jgi:hypothetical protein